LSPGDPPWFVEYVAISPNAGDSHPRLLGLAFPPSADEGDRSDLLRYRRGDASEPIGADEKLLLQIVNDRAQIWGGGFAKQVRRKWPRAQASFREWTFQSGHLKLGNIHSFMPRPDLTLVSLVAQHGFGKASSGPRLRYGALFSCMEKVAQVATSLSASVHMPRIGTGAAGGSWSIVEGIIRDALVARGIRVTVYDLSAARAELPTQTSLEIPFEGPDDIV
jgi:O-acetyl-ADP-ribose deacetylase (regulator of RNase III)